MGEEQWAAAEVSFSLVVEEALEVEGGVVEGDEALGSVSGGRVAWVVVLDVAELAVEVDDDWDEVVHPLLAVDGVVPRMVVFTGVVGELVKMPLLSTFIQNVYLSEAIVALKWGPIK